MAEQTAPTDRVEQARPDVTNIAKKAYHCPQLTSLGTVEQLTLGGTTGGGETFGASL